LIQQVARPRGQPPSSYQAFFDSAEHCEAARKAVLAEGARLRAESEKRGIMGQMQALGTQVTAICAAGSGPPDISIR
jgi:hypothetical protein